MEQFKERPFLKSFQHFSLEGHAEKETAGIPNFSFLTENFVKGNECVLFDYNYVAEKYA